MFFTFQQTTRIPSDAEESVQNEECTYKTMLHIGNSFTSQKCYKYGSREACMRENP
jgi:hypothetical protein